MTGTKPQRSVSQYNQYNRCPYSYYLQRIERVWQRPAAWLAQGIAVHEAGEAWERSGRTMTLEEVQEVFRESYQREINEACEVTPNFEYWSKSGPYDGERDTERRYQLGLDQCVRMLTWYDRHPEEVVWVSPDGQPGIELGFNMDLDGIEIRGFIDLVMSVPDGPTDTEVLVRDNKTGNQPGDDFQLGVYSVAIEDAFGVKPEKGDYWMGRSGKPTYPFDLRDWTRGRVSDAFQELETGISAEMFDPDPSPDKCMFCDVNASCPYAV